MGTRALEGILPTVTSFAELASAHIERVMELAREHLGMDVAFVSSFEGGRQIYQSVTGDADSFGLEVGVGPTLDATFCAQMVRDDTMSVIPDTRLDGRVRDLPTTSMCGIGAYVGVPVRLPDGTLYGTFCCMSHAPDPTLTYRDAQFMRLLVDLIADDVARERDREAARAQISDVLRDESLTTALQPIVDLGTGRCIGVEALSRFRPDLGTPDLVFASAYDAGLGAELERLAVTSAFAKLPAIGDDQFLAINVGPDVVRAMAHSVDVTADVPWHRLVAEITEHAPVDSYRELRDALQPLRERGLRIAIDDAGAGFASLQHVVELHPDIIKIDRALVDGMADDALRRSVVASFVLVGLELNAMVLAEGLEREEDLATARRLGVRAGQGYLFARPSTHLADHDRWARRFHK